MSHAPTEPTDASPAAAVDAPSNDRLGPTRLQRTTAIVATIGVAVALIGLVTMLRPVQTPLQDCGTTLTFLLDGRVNEFGDPNDPPKGLTADEVTANNDRPCRVRVGAQAKPAGVLIAGGIVAAVGAGATEITARMVAWRRRVRDRTRPGHPLAPRG